MTYCSLSHVCCPHLHVNNEFESHVNTCKPHLLPNEAFNVSKGDRIWDARKSLKPNFGFEYLPAPVFRGKKTLIPCLPPAQCVNVPRKAGDRSQDTGKVEMFQINTFFRRPGRTKEASIHPQYKNR